MLQKTRDEMVSETAGRPTVVDVYTGMQANYASDRHIYMLAIISRKIGKLVYII